MSHLSSMTTIRSINKRFVYTFIQKMPHQLRLILPVALWQLLTTRALPQLLSRQHPQGSKEYFSLVVEMLSSGLNKIPSIKVILIKHTRTLNISTFKKTCS